MLTVISPHLDDAVLSLGGWLSARSEIGASVVTVFAGLPDRTSQRGLLTPFDEGTGFDSSIQAVTRRKEEDARAMGQLRAQFTHLHYLDGQYLESAGETRDQDHGYLVLELKTLCFNADQIAVPLGLAHPDHRHLARACREAFSGRELLIYEELPAATLWPEERRIARKPWIEAGWDMFPAEITVVKWRKRMAVECYASQTHLPELAFENLTEERLWTAPYEG